MPQAINLGLTFQKTARRVPKNIALVYPEGKELVRRSFAEMELEISAWVKYLQAKGIKAGDRVAAISPKCPNHYRFLHACWYIGAIAVPICETLAPCEMGFIIKDCGASIVLVDKALAEKVKEAAGDIECIDWQTLPLTSDSIAEPSDIDIDEVAALIYTSGSTGMPKGVMLTHRNLWINTWSALQFYKIIGTDSVMSLLPYWHAYALVCEIGCTVQAGCACKIPKDIRDFKKNLGKYQPTIVLAVPRIVDGFKSAIDKAVNEATPKQKSIIQKAIHNASRIFTAGPKLNGGFLRYITHYCFYDPFVFKKFRKALGGKVRAIVCGGAPLDLEIQIFFKYFGISLFQGYGLSEASPVISSNIWDRHQLGSCGPLFPWLFPELGGDYTFKDEEGHMGKDIWGQLLVKGQCVMKGYWNHTDASAKTMENGWLCTGDMGHCDERGNLFILGRIGNMIVLQGGEKFHPEPVEDAVKNSPMISEAMVIGEKCKNVYVCVNVPKDVAEKYSAADLRKALREEVANYVKELTPLQRPKDVLVLPEFNIEDGTLTATFKVRRFKIKEKYGQMIEDFLASNGEEIATKHEMKLEHSKVLESLGEGEAVVGVKTIVKK